MMLTSNFDDGGREWFAEAFSDPTWTHGSDTKIAGGSYDLADLNEMPRARREYLDIRLANYRPAGLG